MSDLGSVIIGEPDDSARTPQLRQGVVTQVSPLLVRVGSSTSATPCNSLGSYAPTVGDVVSVLVLSGDRLVLGRAGADGARAAVRYETALSFATQSVNTSGSFLVGSITVPTASYNRVLIVSFVALATASPAVDFQMIAPGGVLARRIRGTPNGESVAFTAHFDHGAGVSGNNFAMKVAAVSGTATVGLAGSGDLNYLAVTAIPAT